MVVNREPGNPQADAASSASPGVGKSLGEVQVEFPSLSFIFLWSCSCELLSLTTRGQAAVRNKQDPESPAPSEPPSHILPSHNPPPQAPTVHLDSPRLAEHPVVTAGFLSCS